MTKEELEKATGQELIDARNYCGVDGYYGDYLDNVNAEMLKRFNCLAKLEKENAELKDDNKVMADNYSKMEQKFYDNLTKAKELLRYYFDCFKNDNKYTLSDFEVVEDTEQFLNSEVEK